MSTSRGSLYYPRPSDEFVGDFVITGSVGRKPTSTCIGMGTRRPISSSAANRSSAAGNSGTAIRDSRLANSWHCIPPIVNGRPTCSASASRGRRNRHRYGRGAGESLRFPFGGNARLDEQLSAGHCPFHGFPFALVANRGQAGRLAADRRPSPPTSSIASPFAFCISRGASSVASHESKFGPVAATTQRGIRHCREPRGINDSRPARLYPAGRP